MPCRSLVWRTQVGVLPDTRQVVRRGGYWAVRTPQNPSHWWGNYLLFDDPPGAGVAERWEAHFAREFADLPAVGHRLFAWDRTDGDAGSAAGEFGARGYQVERSVGLSAAPGEIVEHPRANLDVAVSRLGGAADARWADVLELWCRQQAEGRLTPAYRRFAEARLDELRGLFAAGRGAWFVALHGGDVVASLGVVNGGSWIRYQYVDTDEAHRGRGIATRLVAEAGRWASRAFPGARRLVIVADPDYHAARIYQSVGFSPFERVSAVILPSPA